MNEQEYNKRCALFLGFNFEEWKGKDRLGDDLSDTYYWYDKEGNPIDELLFHSDWNWIHDVINAIEKKSKYIIMGRDLYNSFDIGRYSIKFHFSPNNKYLLQLELKQFLPKEPFIHTMYKHHIIKEFDFKTKGKKEAVVEAINQFLIWYENNK